MILAIVAAVLFQAQRDGVEVKIESETERIDPAKSVFLRVEIKAPRGAGVQLPDLRDRANGFSLAEDFVEDVLVDGRGREVRVANWRLVPEPVAAFYRLRPFAVGDIVCGPVYFGSPDAREEVSGGMEVDPKKDFPPLSWKLAVVVAAFLSAIAAIVAVAVYLVRLAARKIREHRMSPIERAWAELDRLMKKGLPGRGRYKDFYVELTMVVRRYIQRKYGIRAPHMTTEEFLQTASPSDELRRFLQSADMVKFAGVEATPEMADESAECARDYLRSDDRSNDGGKK